MKMNEREVYFFDVASRAWNRKYKALSPFPHYELARALETAFKAERASHTNSARQAIYISDIRVGYSAADILIGFSDTLASDPTFHDKTKRSRRTVQKQGDEGLEHSAHIHWAYETTKATESKPILIERAPMLAAGRIAAFLNRLLRVEEALSREFTRPAPTGELSKDGSPRTVRVRPYIELLGHPSKEFLRDLKSGVLSGLELYTEERRSEPWDANAYTVHERESMILKPNGKAKVLPNPLSLLRGLLPSAKDDFEYCKVSFKTEAGISRAVDIFTDRISLRNEGHYVRKEKLTGFQSALPTAFETLYDPIASRMKSLLKP